MPNDRHQRLAQFRQHLEETRKLQDDILKYGLEAAHLYFEDVDGDWLEGWGEGEEGKQNLVESLSTFLQSDDSVAVRVRKQLKNKSLQEIAVELEKCLSLSEEEEIIFAVKNVLAGNVVIGESNRESSNEIDEIELLDLAEDLVEKLTGISEEHK